MYSRQRTAAPTWAFGCLASAFAYVVLGFLVSGKPVAIQNLISVLPIPEGSLLRIYLQLEDWNGTWVLHHVVPEGSILRDDADGRWVSENLINISMEVVSSERTVFHYAYISPDVRVGDHLQSKHEEIISDDVCNPASGDSVCCNSTEGEQPSRRLVEDAAVYTRGILRPGLLLCRIAVTARVGNRTISSMTLNPCATGMDNDNTGPLLTTMSVHTDQREEVNVIGSRGLQEVAVKKQGAPEEPPFLVQASLNPYVPNPSSPLGTGANQIGISQASWHLCADACNTEINTCTTTAVGERLQDQFEPFRDTTLHRAASEGALGNPVECWHLPESHPEVTTAAEDVSADGYEQIFCNRRNVMHVQMTAAVSELGLKPGVATFEVQQYRQEGQAGPGNSRQLVLEVANSGNITDCVVLQPGNCSFQLPQGTPTCSDCLLPVSPAPEPGSGSSVELCMQPQETTTIRYNLTTPPSPTVAGICVVLGAVHGQDVLADTLSFVFVSPSPPPPPPTTAPPPPPPSPTPQFNHAPVALFTAAFPSLPSWNSLSAAALAQLLSSYRAAVAAASGRDGSFIETQLGSSSVPGGRRLAATAASIATRVEFARSFTLDEALPFWAQVESGQLAAALRDQVPEIAALGSVVIVPGALEFLLVATPAPTPAPSPAGPPTSSSSPTAGSGAGPLPSPSPPRCGGAQPDCGPHGQVVGDECGCVCDSGWRTPPLQDLLNPEWCSEQLPAGGASDGPTGINGGAGGGSGGGGSGMSTSSKLAIAFLSIASCLAAAGLAFCCCTRRCALPRNPRSMFTEVPSPSRQRKPSQLCVRHAAASSGSSDAPTSSCSSRSDGSGEGSDGRQRVGGYSIPTDKGRGRSSTDDSSRQSEASGSDDASWDEGAGNGSGQPPPQAMLAHAAAGRRSQTQHPDASRHRATIA